MNSGGTFRSQVEHRPFALGAAESARGRLAHVDARQVSTAHGPELTWASYSSSSKGQSFRRVGGIVGKNWEDVGKLRNSKDEKER